jgi:hypothetical protein
VDDNLGALLILIIIVSLACVALAVVLDKRSQRSYTLGALALATLVLALWGFRAFSQAAGAVASSADSLEVVAYALVYFVGELCLAVALTLCAVVVALMARQWWWVGVIVIVSVVPAIVVFTSPAALLPNLLDALELPRSAVAMMLTLPPVLVTFAYAVARSIRRPLAG